MSTNPAPAPPKRSARIPMAGMLGLGLITDFLDSLGIGSFATTTTALKLGKVVDDDEIPGTLNVGHSIPSMLESVLFLTALSVDLLTLVVMVGAGVLGAWFGTGIVVRWPKRTVQRAMAFALLVTAGFIVLRQFNTLQVTGGSLGLSGWKLAVAAAASLVIGALTSLGIGNYAPTMALTYMLGMDSKAVFPVMATAAALILPTAAVQFFRAGRFDRRTALGLTLGGVPGVLVAVYLVKELPKRELLWVVVAVLLYTSVSLLLSARKTEQELESVGAPVPNA